MLKSLNFIRKYCTNHLKPDILYCGLEKTDPQLANLLKCEMIRQKTTLQLIASENFTSISVLEALSSCLHNKYSEGLPGKRYYGGTEYIDAIEMLAQERALDAFDLNVDDWGVNVQPYSGSPANFAIYTALLQPHDRLMGLDLPDGGHLTHGFKTPSRKVSASSIYFESMPYKINPQTSEIDYEMLEKTAKLFRPKMIIAGASSYSRTIDYERFKNICDKTKSYLFADISHVAGLMAAKVIPSAFEYADVVMTTMHKTLRGPRAAVIFYRRHLETKINNAVFPGIQGGPHNNTIAAIATAFKQTKRAEFVEYQRQVVRNAKHFAATLQRLGYKIVSDGTDNHTVIIDLRKTKMPASFVESCLSLVNIICNKNTIPGDISALNPSGIRLGTPSLTTRGMKEKDFENIAKLIDRTLKYVNGKQYDELNVSKSPELNAIYNEVITMCNKFPMPVYNNY